MASPNYTRFLVTAVTVAVLLGTGKARADVIGLAALRAYDPTLTGAGVYVAQPEGSLDASPAPSRFEVNPTFPNQPASLFTYISAAGTVVGAPPPNAAGTESSHASGVGYTFYGNTVGGIAPGVSHVDNYDADFFINTIIGAGTAQPAISGKIVNESFVVTNKVGTPIQDQAVDAAYDNYVARYRTIFVSAAGNGGKPYSPSTAYNQISVGASNSTATTSIGPTTDGRSKPDLSAPADETSFAAPQVSGAATLLYQAGSRGDGGGGTSALAVDDRAIKALLLNGAVKPAGWTHTTTTPLDPRYGAGVLNVFNSDQQLRGGRQTPAVGTNPLLGGAHAPPTGSFANVPTASGWDLNAIASSAATDAVSHYFFNLSAGGSPYTLTSTLTWDRQLNQTAINNLDLFLYNATTGSLVDQSISGLDNVEHLYDPSLPAGRYDLEVLKHGGLAGSSVVSDSETYGLAFSFAAVPEPATALGALGLLFVVSVRRPR